MKQIWITHVHILCSKTLKRQEVWKKNSKRKRVKKWNVCTSSSPQVVQVKILIIKISIYNKFQELKKNIKPFGCRPLFKKKIKL